MYRVQRAPQRALAGLLVAAAAAAQGVSSFETSAPVGSVQDLPIYGCRQQNGVAHVFGLIPQAVRMTDTAYFTDTQFGNFVAAPMNAPANPTGGYSTQPGLDIYRTASDGAGGWFVAGAFTAMKGVPVAGVAHLTADGDFDPTWNAALSLAPGVGFSGFGFVSDLAVSNGVLYLAGGITAVAGQPRSGLAAVSVATGAPLPWGPLLSGPSFGTLAHAARIVVSGNVVYAAGDFALASGSPRYGMAAFDATTGALLPWSPATAGDPVSNVTAIAPVGTRVFLGGVILGLGGQVRSGLAAVDAVTGALDPWAPALSLSTSAQAPRAYSLAYDGSTLHVAGWFDAVGGVARSGYVGFALPGGGAPATTPTTFDPQMTETFGSAGIGSSVAFDGVNVYVAGLFATFAGVARLGAAAFDPATNALTAWDPRLVGPPKHLALAGGVAAFAGTYGGDAKARGGVLQVDLATGAATAFDPVFTPAGALVLDVLPDGGALYVGGTFTSVAGSPTARLAKLDATTGAVLPWSPAPNGFVDTMTLDGGTLYVGGSFTTIAGQPRAGFAAFDTATGNLLPWTTSATLGANPAGKKLTAKSGVVWCYGSFDTVGGVLRKNVAALDPTTGATLPFNARIQNGAIVKSLDAAGDVVYFSGDFTLVFGQLRQGIAACAASTGAFTAWSPQLQALPAVGTPSMAFGLYVAGGMVYVQGAGNLGVNGVARPYLAEIDRTTGAVTPFTYAASPTTLGGASAIAAPFFYGGKLFAAVRGALRSFDALLPEASASDVGGGCGLALSATPPRLGEFATTALSGGPPIAPGVFAFGVASGAATPLPTCTIGLDLTTTYVLLPVATDALGSASVTFGLPADPAWWGLSMRLQAATVGGGGGVQFSNAVDAVFGY